MAMAPLSSCSNQIVYYKNLAGMGICSSFAQEQDMPAKKPSRTGSSLEGYGGGGLFLFPRYDTIDTKFERGNILHNVGLLAELLLRTQAHQHM